jgi:hypothetical protein
VAREALVRIGALYGIEVSEPNIKTADITYAAASAAPAASF